MMKHDSEENNLQAVRRTVEDSNRQGVTTAIYGCSSGKSDVVVSNSNHSTEATDRDSTEIRPLIQHGEIRFELSSTGTREITWAGRRRLQYEARVAETETCHRIRTRRSHSHIWTFWT